MTIHPLDRRRFLSVLMAGSSALALACESQKSPYSGELLVSAQGDQKYTVSALGTDGQARSVASLFRGHGLTIIPQRPGSVLMFARRPGLSCLDVDLVNAEPRQVFYAEENRIFSGHGCFSTDGTKLFTSEMDAQTGDGKIGIRDGQSYEFLGELDTHGIGPHEIKLLPDGRTLVVANGGILTRPETGREKLNLDTMASSLVYLDHKTGQVLETVRVPEEKASIRHLDVAPDGTVAIAMQIQREAMNTDRPVPLGAIHRRGDAIQLLDEPTEVIELMNDYIGSVAINHHTGVVAFTSPRGNLVAFWALSDGLFIGYHHFADVSGVTISADQRQFVISNSLGEIRRLDALTLREDRAARWRDPELRWDNHMIMVEV